MKVEKAWSLARQAIIYQIRRCPASSVMSKAMYVRGCWRRGATVTLRLTVQAARSETPFLAQ
jgi:hypothetical protein